MNAKFSISVIEVKICPDCGCEHISDMEQCDMCIMQEENEAFETNTDDMKQFRHDDRILPFAI